MIKKLLIMMMLLSWIIGASAQNYSDNNDKINIPFQTSELKNGKFGRNCHWYRIKLASGKYWIAKDAEVDCGYVNGFDDSHIFCFVGDNVQGFKIFNRMLGADKILYCASSASHEPLVPTMLNTAKAPMTFKISQNQNGHNFYYPGVARACINDLRDAGVLTLWTNDAAPSGAGCRMFFEEVEVDDPMDEPAAWLEPIQGTVTYVYLTSGAVDAYPSELIIEQVKNSSIVSFKDKKGTTYEYAAADVAEVNTTAPTTAPMITSFKFNNKFNDMLMTDADGVIDGDSAIHVAVGGIGKRLVPSFKVSESNASVWVGMEKQMSKVTSRRFEEPTLYTVAYDGYKMLRETLEGELVMVPFGRDYVVTVDYLSDHPTTDYGVPVIRINTSDGSMISSKNFYWDATITIDGAGYFSDMDEMPIQIKGRGNSSWAGTWGKSPYHLKFAEKQKPLGMTAGKHWNLIANAIEGSMTTNVIGSRVAEMVDCAWANHFIPVELFINGDYRGSYTLTEKVGFGNNSIDIADETNAALLELDSYFDAQYKFKTTLYSLPVNVKEPDFAEGTTGLTLNAVQNNFNKLTNALGLRRHPENYVDIESLASFLMMNELIVNQELMHPKSMFCYNANVRDTESKYVFGPAWDFDWGFGYENSRKYFSADAKANFWTMSSHESTKFIKELRYNMGEELNKQYYRVWTDFVDNHLEDLIEYCNDYYEVAANSFQHNSEKWGGSGKDGYKNITEKSITWLRTRTDYVYNYVSNTLGYASKGYLDDPDVNGDGLIDTQDVLAVYEYMKDGGEIMGEDVNHDGLVDTQDVLIIYQNMMSMTKIRK